MDLASYNTEGEVEEGNSKEIKNNKIIQDNSKTIRI